MQYTSFALTRDINGYNGFGLPFSINNYGVELAESTDTTLTTPSYAKQYIAIFSYPEGSTVWVAVNATAAAPSTSSFAALTSTLNPTARQLNAGDVLHFYTTASNTPQIGVTYYALQD